MPNQVILPAQRLSLSDLKNSLPNQKIKKVFFQCELRSIANNNATFGIIAYAGKRNLGNKWVIGSKVSCQDDPSKPVQYFDIPIAFGNNELVDFDFTVAQKKSKKTNPNQVKQDELMSLLNRIIKSKDKEKLKNTFLLFKARLTKNPHITYDVSLDGTSAATNPSPPAPPAG